MTSLAKRRSWDFDAGAVRALALVGGDPLGIAGGQWASAQWRWLAPFCQVKLGSARIGFWRLGPKCVSGG